MEGTSPKPFVFVLMPFAKEFDDVYLLGIKPACEKAGAYAERVDEQIFHESILQRIYNQISKADVIIADMTGRNPNVFYEVGYAHALGKPVILLTRTADDIPFDLQHYAHIVHGGRISDLIPELIKRVTFAIEKPKEATQQIGVEAYVDGKSLRACTKLVHKINKKKNEGRVEFRFDFHNAGNIRLRKASFQIGFLTPGGVGTVFDDLGSTLDGFASYTQPDGRSILYLSPRSYTILPGSWDRAWIIFEGERASFQPGETVELALRIFTEDGPSDFPFTVEIAS